MKKRIIIAATAVLLSVCASAQNALSLDNTYISVYGGISSMYVHSQGTGYKPLPSGTFEIAAGKWFTPTMGMRAGLQYGGLREFGSKPKGGVYYTLAEDGRYKIVQRFGYAHADLMWNPMGLREDSIFSIVPYLHAGLLGTAATRSSGALKSILNVEFAAGAGMLGSFRISPRLSAELDLRVIGYDAEHTGNALDHRVLASSAMLGLSYHMGQSHWSLLPDHVWDHSFAQAGFGLAKFSGIKTAKMYSASLGRWFSPTFGGRIGCNWNSTIQYVHGDFLWDIFKYLGGGDDYMLSFVPYASAGFAHSRHSSIELALGAGAMAHLNFGSRASLFVDLGAMAMNGRIFDKNGLAYGVSALGGFQFNMGQTQWRRTYIADPRDGSERDILNGVFVSIGGGVNCLYSTISNFQWYDGCAPAVSIDLGKWFTPIVGARIGGQGIMLKTPGRSGEGRKTLFAYGHGDLLWNATNTILGYDGRRHFVDVSPYAHFGLMVERHGIRDQELASGTGVLLDFNVSDRASIFADMRNFLVKGRSSNQSRTKLSFMTTALAGVSYRLGEHDWTVECGSFLENTFVGAGGGINGTMLRTAVSPSYELFFGKWFNPYVGGRIGWRGGNLNSGAVHTMSSHFHGDFLWDATAAALGVKTDRIWQIAPYASAGVMTLYDRNASGKNIGTEFVAGAGLYNNFRLAQSLGLYLDLGGSVLPARSARGKLGRLPVDFSGTVGLTYNVGENSWTPREFSLERKWALLNRSTDETGATRQRRRESEWIISDHVIDNTFITVMGGVGSMWAPGMHRGFNGGVSPAMELTAGKWFNPTFGGRIGAQGASAAVFANGEPRKGVFGGQTASGKTRFETGYAYLHGDLLWNVNSAFAGYKPRVWELIPYGSAGFFVCCKSETAKANERWRIDFAAGPGLINRFNLCDRLALDVDLRTLITGSENFPSKNGHKSVMTSAMMGLTWALGRPDWVSARWDHAPLFGGRSRDAKGFVANTGFIDNSFISFSYGVNHKAVKSLRGIGQTLDVVAGKWFSPYFAGRIGFEADFDNGKKLYSFEHLDFVGNATAVLLGYKADRRLNIDPYLTIGILNDGEQHSTPVKAGAGIIGSVALGERLSLNIEGRALLLERRSAMLSAMAGVSYAIGATTWKRACVGGEEPDTLGNPARKFSLATNLLGYIDGTFNLEAQYAVGRHWTLDARVGSNTHSYGLKDKHNQKQFVAIGARMWPWYTYSGLWFRADAQVETYHSAGIPRLLNSVASSKDIAERGNAYGAGLSLGYALMITKHFNLDFGIGAWGGVKNYAQYSPAGGQNNGAGNPNAGAADGLSQSARAWSEGATVNFKRANTPWQTKGFISLSTLSISATFVF